MLSRHRHRRVRRVLVFRKGLRSPLRTHMDYAIAGIATVFLFAYLIYALLRPEKF
jgi:K+-transporting ATPase KdpF subunit